MILQINLFFELSAVSVKCALYCFVKFLDSSAILFHWEKERLSIRDESNELMTGMPGRSCKRNSDSETF